ncbi:DUF4383 domain-containing protein [Subtercola sp. Z020]|uniref:DUF4383 domain-containing protein n=1 Tax=Subtercola sp. Z020 TaxID=2080582 RepID=UPI000CE93668|nr:DUF4383 domain-containing protein [Subtercola sp. Z020]PPF79339.1 DUF4383 domain-containing protein [Subtercola sp. Z020]
MSTAASTPNQRRERSAVQTVALVVGIVFLLVGVAGFIPGLTTDMSGMDMAGHTSDSMLMGLFQVSVLHNIVHLLFGIAGVLFSRTARAARNYLVWGGVIYLVLWIYGLIVGNDDRAANFVPLNTADNWLHLFLGVGMLLLGLLLPRAVAGSARGTRAQAR